MADVDADIKKIRERINNIDKKIVELLAKRVKEAKKLYLIKEEKGLPVFDPAREQEVLKRIEEETPKWLEPSALKSVFREIISLTRAAQKRETVCFLGPEGTFTHQAALTFFGGSSKFEPAGDVEDVFTKVETGLCDYGVIPVENSLQGTVGAVLDRLYTTSLFIIGEVFLRISLALLSPGSADSIETIYSHPHAIAQCRGWLRRHFPRARIVEVESTAQAVKIVREKKNAAAVASALAGEIYEVPVIAAHISDHKNNYTRFLILARKPLQYAGERPKTSIIFTVSHRPGSLFQALEGFAREKINLTKIESRPLKESPWEYAFFVDFEGSGKNPRVRRALSVLKEVSTFLKVLGTYPAGDLPV